MEIGLMLMSAESFRLATELAVTAGPLVGIEVWTDSRSQPQEEEVREAPASVSASM